MDERQQIIDALIDHIDKAIKKGSVTNQQVASVLDFLNERLKLLSRYDIEELGKTFLRKDIPDSTRHLLELLGGLTAGEFISGLSGALLDEKGNLEVESALIRSGLHVKELIFNNITVSDSKHFWSAGGKIEKCEKQSDFAYLLTIENPLNAKAIQFQVDDILLGNFNQSGGFFDSYMRVIHVNVSANTVLVVMADDTAVASGKNYPPCELMHLARIGNFTNPDRQASIYLDADTLQLNMLNGVDNYIIRPINKKVFIGSIDTPKSLGLPESLPLRNGDMVGFFDVLLAKTFITVDDRAQIIRKEINRDLWEEDPKDSHGNDWPYTSTETEVHYSWWLNSRWKCIVPVATKGLAPGTVNPEWLMVSGDPTLSMRIISSNGVSFRPLQVDTVLEATVLRGGVEDLTDIILDTDWLWKRESGNPLSDTSWNSSHIGVTGKLHITYQDMGPSWPGKSVKFICTAFVRVGDKTMKVEQFKKIKP